MPRAPSWVDQILDDVQGGFNLTAMTKTAGKMLLAADRLADRLADAALAEEVNSKTLADYAQSVKLIAQAIQMYAGIYTWCEQYSVPEEGQGNALGDLLPVLEAGEIAQLQRWLGRIKARQLG